MSKNEKKRCIESVRRASIELARLRDAYTDDEILEGVRKNFLGYLLVKRAKKIQK